MPYTGPASIVNVDMGTQKSVSGGELPAGSAFYVAVQSRDNAISILAIDVDPAVRDGSLAELSRSKAIGIARILGGLSTFEDTTSHAYNAEFIKQLTPEMQTKIANYGLPMAGTPGR